MDVVTGAIGAVAGTVLQLFQMYNPVLVICGATFAVGMFFLVLSFLRTLWSAHVTIRLGPITLVVVAVVVSWLQLSDGARGKLGEWIKMTPSELYAILFMDVQ
jgi:hypothetical protein